MVVISESFRKVVVLTDVVAKICAGLEIGALVDLGSGKGYLSQVRGVQMRDNHTPARGIMGLM